MTADLGFEVNVFHLPGLPTFNESYASFYQVCMVRLPGLRLRQVAGRGHGIEDWEAATAKCGFGISSEISTVILLRSFQFFPVLCGPEQRPLAWIATVC